MASCKEKWRLRVLHAEFKGFRTLMNERDTANKEAVKVALSKAEKATERTDEALKEYKASANEWRDTVKDMIGNLRESRSETTGHASGVTGTILMIIGAAGAVGGLIGFFVHK